jgi:hypothetical protein
MNREHLAGWSLELADEAFPEALAALGALTALPPAKLAAAFGPDGWRPDVLAALLDGAVSGSGVLHWTLPTAPPRLRITPAGAARPLAEPAPEGDVLVEVWREFLTGLRRRDDAWRMRLRIAVRMKSGAAAGSMALASLLAHPQVHAAGIYMDEAFASDGRTDWRWPFTIATLPDDPLTAPLAALQQQFPPVWPFRFISAGRDHPRVEVLVIGAAAHNALTRVLESRLRLRCCLVIVAGLGSDSPRTAEPLLRALVAKLEAEGVAVLEAGTSPQDFAERLKHFAYELTHNKTLDVALTEAFRPGLLLLLNRDLLSVSHLDTSVGNMAQRLRKLPQGAEVTLSERAFRASRPAAGEHAPGGAAHAIALGAARAIRRGGAFRPRRCHRRQPQAVPLRQRGDGGVGGIGTEPQHPRRRVGRRAEGGAALHPPAQPAPAGR